MGGCRNCIADGEQRQESCSLTENAAARCGAVAAEPADLLRDEVEELVARRRHEGLGDAVLAGRDGVLALALEVNLHK
jgi:hypothetical protein